MSKVTVDIAQVNKSNRVGINIVAVGTSSFTLQCHLISNGNGLNDQLDRTKLEIRIYP